MSARPRPQSVSDYQAAVASGPQECSPGKPCRMLANALDETARLAGSRLFVGLVRFFTTGSGDGVAYMAGKGAPLAVINLCPWCGKSPNGRAAQ